MKKKYGIRILPAGPMREYTLEGTEEEAIAHALSFLPECRIGHGGVQVFDGDRLVINKTRTEEKQGGT